MSHSTIGPAPLGLEPYISNQLSLQSEIGPMDPGEAYGA